MSTSRPSLLPMIVHGTTVDALEARLTDYAAWKRDLLAGINKGPEAYRLAKPRVISFEDDAPPCAVPARNSRHNACDSSREVPVHTDTPVPPPPVDYSLFAAGGKFCVSSGRSALPERTDDFFNNKPR
jgi:hypothetical protein